VTRPETAVNRASSSCGLCQTGYNCCCKNADYVVQALAKIAVRSGEPFRVQCYSVLATAAGGSIAHRARSSSRGSHAAAAGSSNSSQAAAASAAAAAAVAEGATADPLGVAAVAGPALEVLDHIYAGAMQRIRTPGTEHSGVWKGEQRIHAWLNKQLQALHTHPRQLQFSDSKRHKLWQCCRHAARTKHIVLLPHGP
jgi:hypothetical protein